MGNNQKYPQGTQFNDYCIIHEKQGHTIVPTIRRWIIFPNGNRKLERYPTKRYKDIRSNQRELEDFVIRLNNQVPAELKTRESVEIKHTHSSAPKC